MYVGRPLPARPAPVVPNSQADGSYAKPMHRPEDAGQGRQFLLTGSVTTGQASLSTRPGLADKAQFYDNSCGAVSLLCAGKELGLTRLPDLKGSPTWNGQPLCLDNMTESAVYQVTSRSRPSADLRNAGYSYPDNVVLTAQFMGLEGWIHIESTVFSAVLKARHADVVQRLEESGIPILEGGPVELSSNQRELRIVAPLMGIGGLHYVLHRPDGTFMDPADGKNYEDFDGMNNGLKSYVDTGLSIVLELVTL